MAKRHVFLFLISYLVVYLLLQFSFPSPSFPFFSFLYFLHIFFICLFVPPDYSFPPPSFLLSLYLSLRCGHVIKFDTCSEITKWRRKTFSRQAKATSRTTCEVQTDLSPVRSQDSESCGKTRGEKKLVVINCSVLLTSGAGDETKFNNNGFMGIVKQANVFRLLYASM